MDWSKVSAIVDIVILVVLVSWMTMDRCNFYWRDKE